MTYEPVTIVLDETAVTVASWRDLYVVVWHGTSTLSVLRRVVEQQERFAKASRGGKVAILTVLAAAAIALPDAEMRAVMDASRRATRENTRAEAVVLPGGFVAATVRGVIAGVTLVHRPPFPTKVVGTLTEACEFLAPLLEPVDKQPVSPGRLEVVLEALRARGPRQR